MTKIYSKIQLLVNNKIGEAIAWEERLSQPELWLYSYKLDGGRVEIPETGEALSREMKLIKSKQVQAMAKEVRDTFTVPGMLEAEFYAPGMTFPEIMHFFKTEDVTSEKTIQKYFKLWIKTDQGTLAFLKGTKYLVKDLTPAELKKSIHWHYPGRTPEWLCQWHDELKFYVFDHVFDDEYRTKEERYSFLITNSNTLGDHCKLIHQAKLKHIDQFYQMYDQAMLDEIEGLVVMKRDGLYKRGRTSLNNAIGYKVKNDNQEFEGVIFDVPESTIAIEGSEKTINNFGRSKTSQLAEDREPSGMAKGLSVRMDNGVELIVSFSDFNHDDRVKALQRAELFIGRRIKFSGAPPVKKNGSPRHGHFKKGGFINEKKVE